MTRQFPNEILNKLVSVELCDELDLSTVEIKPINGGGVTDSVDGSSPNQSFMVSFHGGERCFFIKVCLILAILPFDFTVDQTILHILLLR